ncbi:GNAT family N-acetyltransferase [Embleya scabrispora]|nr:GNAT family N-acetyltransferase [Embleya scabrispora]
MSETPQTQLKTSGEPDVLRKLVAELCAVLTDVQEIAHKTYVGDMPQESVRALAGRILRVIADDSTAGARLVPAHFTIRNAQRADADTFVGLIGQINPESPNLPHVRRAIDNQEGVSLRANNTLALVAVGRHGKPIGALLGGIPQWLIEDRSCPPAYRLPLMTRVAYISSVFVTPACRGTGVGRALIGHAETLFHAGGRTIVTLVHSPELIPYYRALGYTAFTTFAAHLSKDALLRLDSSDGSLVATKALDESVGRAVIFGLPVPVITGILESLPPSAWYDGERLRF